MSWTGCRFCINIGRQYWTDVLLFQVKGKKFPLSNCFINFPFLSIHSLKNWPSYILHIWHLLPCLTIIPNPLFPLPPSSIYVYMNVYKSIHYQWGRLWGNMEEEGLIWNKSRTQELEMEACEKWEQLGAPQQYILYEL